MRQACITELTADGDNITGAVLDDGQVLKADYFVLAAGNLSCILMRSLTGYFSFPFPILQCKIVECTENVC